MINASHTNASRERIISTQQTSGEKLSPRVQLENLVIAFASKAANIPSEETFAKLADLLEQLTLLDAIEFGFIKPLPAKERGEQLRCIECEKLFTRDPEDSHNWNICEDCRAKTGSVKGRGGYGIGQSYGITRRGR